MALCFFFGHEIKPGHEGQATAPAGSILNVTHAAMAQSAGKGESVRLFAEVASDYTDDSSPKFCVAVLTSGVQESIGLNLNFGAVETVKFSTEGKVPVHITGYYNITDVDLHDDDDDSDDSSDDNDVAKEMEDSDEDEEYDDADEEEMKELEAHLNSLSPQERDAFLKSHGIAQDDDEDGDNNEDEDDDEDDEDLAELKELEAELLAMTPEERAEFLKAHGIDDDDDDDDDDEMEVKVVEKKKSKKEANGRSKPAKKKRSAKQAKDQRKKRKTSN